MASKKFWMRMLVIVMVFGMMVINLIFPARVTADDLWANVPNLNLLNGTWKGSFSQSLTDKEYMERTDAPQGVKVLNIIHTIEVEITIIFDASTETISKSGTIKTTLSGTDINLLQMKHPVGEVKTSDGTGTIIFDDANHSQKFTFFDIKSYEDETEDMTFQVNQTRTKIKIISLDLGGGDIGKILPGSIMTKQ